MNFLSAWMLCVVAALQFTANAQLNIQLVSEDAFPTFTIPILNIESGNSALTPLVDRLERPYVYVASNELGLHIYATDPVLNLVATLDTTQLGAKVSSLDQSGNLLILGLGDIFRDTLGPLKVASVDISNPLNPLILDSWIDPNPTPNRVSGVGVVRIKDDLAYLGGMGEGLVILDISDPNNLSFVSKLHPPIAYPHPMNTDEKVNARGMAIQDTLVFLSYDAGGVRVINCADVFNPVQIMEFANDITFVPSNMPRAYNHLALDDTVLYVAVDYCGVEVWGVGNPLAPNLLHHWNPVGCPGGGVVWWDADVHTNELKVLPGCDLLFVTTAKSEMMVLDIADPYQPFVVDSFGTVIDTTGTWGLDMDNARIYLTYANVPDLPIVQEPFLSNWGGVKQLSYTHCGATLAENGEQMIRIFPNPTKNSCAIALPYTEFRYALVDEHGRILSENTAYDHTELDMEHVVPGFYLLRLHTPTGLYTRKIVRAD
jgi:hypothetical protein